MDKILQRRRLMMSAKKEITTPYPRVEYLEFTGTQYIDTGIYPEGLSFGYQYKVQFMNNLNQTRSVAGCWGPSWNTSGYCFTVGGNYGSAYLRFGQNWRAGFTASYSQRLADDCQIAEVSFINNNDFNGSGCTFTLSSPLQNGTITFDNIYQGQAARSFIIGGVNSGSVTELAHFKLYYFRIMRYNSPIINLVPVRVGSTGYLYDTVSKQLFGNLGSGVIGIGPDVEQMEYELVEYVEGNNNAGAVCVGEILDTGVFVNDNNYAFYGDYMKLRSFAAWEGYFSNWISDNNNAWRIIQYDTTANKFFANFNTKASGAGNTFSHTDILNVRTIMQLNREQANIGQTVTQRSSSTTGTALPNTMRLGSGRWYGFKIYHNNVLIQDLRPAKDSDNLPCMVDLLTNTLIHSPFLTTS